MPVAKGDDRGVARNALAPAGRSVSATLRCRHLLRLGLAEPAVFLAESRVGYAYELNPRIDRRVDILAKVTERILGVLGRTLLISVRHTRGIAGRIEGILLGRTRIVVEQRLFDRLSVWWDLRQGPL